MRTSAALSIALGVLFLAPGAIQQPPGALHCLWDGDAMVVEGEVNGSGAGWFLLDTGAGATLVDQDFLASVSARPAGTATIAGVGGTREVQRSAVRLTLGATTFSTPVLVTPLVELSESIGRRLLGILGNDVFRRFTLDINFEPCAVALLSPRSGALSPGESVSTFRLRDNQPWVPIGFSVNGRTTIVSEMLLDTGADGAITIDRTFVHLSALLDALRPLKRGRYSVLGIGGPEDIEEFRIRRATMDKYTFRDPTLSVTNGTDDFGAVLGTQVLRRFHVTLDYTSQRVRLRPTNALGDAFETDAVGLWLIAKAPDYRSIAIRAIAPSSPASQSGLRVGDVVLRVDGKDAAEFGLAELRRIFRESGRRHTIEVVRNGQLLVASIKAKSPI